MVEQIINVLNGFIESNWVGDKETKHLTIGHIFKLGNDVVTWCYKKQPILFFLLLKQILDIFWGTKEKTW